MSVDPQSGEEREAPDLEAAIERLERDDVHTSICEATLGEDCDCGILAAVDVVLSELDRLRVTGEPAAEGRGPALTRADSALRCPDGSEHEWNAADLTAGYGYCVRCGREN